MHQERTFHPDATRYHWDFGPCHFRGGWAQWDTTEDAAWYGNWINPIELALVSFAEGDLVQTQCVSPEEFVAEVRRMATWQQEVGYRPRIDAMCQPDIEAAIKRLGLADLLHPETAPA